jgi:hypothetical protein
LQVFAAKLHMILFESTLPDIFQIAGLRYFFQYWPQ